MALDVFGLNRAGSTGMIGGVVRGVHNYATNDAAAQVETNGYFDAVASQFTEGAGDILHVAYDLDGTPGLRSYVVTRTAGDIALTLGTATAAV